MELQEFEKLLAKYGSPAIRRDRTISSRRYNLIVFRYEDGEKKEIETIEYLTGKQARELRAAYLREDNLRCDIVEDITTDRNGNELTFPPLNEVAEVKGIGGFGTPEATRLRIERDRESRRQKAAFKNARAKAIKKALIFPDKSQSYAEMILAKTPGYDPKSSLHEMYLDNVKRNGYTVVDKSTGRIFQGLQNEISQIIIYLVELGRNVKNDLDISFNGV